MYWVCHGKAHLHPHHRPQNFLSPNNLVCPYSFTHLLLYLVWYISDVSHLDYSNKKFHCAEFIGWFLEFIKCICNSNCLLRSNLCIGNVQCNQWDHLFFPSISYWIFYFRFPPSYIYSCICYLHCTCACCYSWLKSRKQF